VLSFEISVFEQIQENWLNCSFLSITDTNDVGQWIVEKLSVAISNTIWDWFYNFSSLFAHWDIVQVNLRVRRHENIEIISKNKTKTKNFLRFWESKFDFFGLFFFKE
jgi:hypothetical protein